VTDPVELPEHPQLRSIAEAAERLGLTAEVFDHKWRTVYVTTELIKAAGLSKAAAAGMIGHSQIGHVLEQGVVVMPADARVRWWERLGPAMRYDVPPEDPDFEAVFGRLAGAARELEPQAPEPAIAFERHTDEAFALDRFWYTEGRDLYLRVLGDRGELAGTLFLAKPALGDALLARLALGKVEMYERMHELREPARRPAAILFADLEASGTLSRQLSSGAYFGLIRALTDVVDSQVASHGGLLGKHAGDGASALFVAADGESESPVARAAIEAARGVRERSVNLLEGEPEVLVNIGLHWGATLTVGQVSSHGRLEVTALGDEMNECARIEGVARGGAVLASKGLIERRTPTLWPLIPPACGSR
jgi:class 3 adenylate cyclase